MTFQDVIKGFKTSNMPQSLSSQSIIATLLITFILAIIIFYTYKKNYSSVSYNHTFNVSLIILSLITASIILTISSNLVLSLGMVGALSIVRFRTAVKEPMDIVYLFWSISLGLTTGAQLFLVALIGTIFISLAIFLLMRYTNSLEIFLLIIHYGEKAQDQVLNKLSNFDYTLKSKRANENNIELTIELKLFSSTTEFVEEIKDINEVYEVSLISYNGEFFE